MWTQRDFLVEYSNFYFAYACEKQLRDNTPYVQYIKVVNFCPNCVEHYFLHDLPILGISDRIYCHIATIRLVALSAQNSMKRRRFGGNENIRMEIGFLNSIRIQNSKYIWMVLQLPVKLVQPHRPYVRESICTVSHCCQLMFGNI